MTVVVVSARRFGDVVGERRGWADRFAVVYGLEGLDDLGQADAVVLRVRQPDDDSMCPAVGFLDHQELNIRLAQFGVCAGAVVAELTGVVLKVHVGFVGHDMGSIASENHLEEAVPRGDEDGPEDIEMLDQCGGSLLKRVQVQKTGPVKGKVIQHPPWFQETACDSQGLEIGDGECVCDAGSENSNLGADVILDERVLVGDLDQ